MQLAHVEARDAGGEEYENSFRLCIRFLRFHDVFVQSAELDLDSQQSTSLLSVQTHVICNEPLRRRGVSDELDRPINL